MMKKYLLRRMIEFSPHKQVISLKRSLWSWRNKNPWQIRKLSECSRIARIINVFRLTIHKNLKLLKVWRAKQLKTSKIKKAKTKWIVKGFKTERNQNLLKKLKFKARREAVLQSLVYRINTIEGSKLLNWMTRINIAIW